MSKKSSPGESPVKPHPLVTMLSPDAEHPPAIVGEASFLAGGAAALLSGADDSTRGGCGSPDTLNQTQCCPDTVEIATVPPKCPAPPPKKPPKPKQ